MRIEEFLKDFPGAEPYRTSIVEILAALGARSVAVRTVDDSRHKVCRADSTAQLLIGRRQSLEAVVFGLFHEYGHMQEPPPDPERTCTEQLLREERAWLQGGTMVAGDHLPAFG